MSSNQTRQIVEAAIIKRSRPVIKFTKSDEQAVTPTKAHPSDIGFDLTAISVYKRVSEKVVLYDTGITVEPPAGYYVEVVARSSISKTGHIQANPPGVIDPHYRGTLLLAVMKVDEDAPELELPFCRFQGILRKAHYCDFEEVAVLGETDRGEGGFGSSDK